MKNIITIFLILSATISCYSNFSEFTTPPLYSWKWNNSKKGDEIRFNAKGIDLIAKEVKKGVNDINKIKLKLDVYKHFDFMCYKVTNIGGKPCSGTMGTSKDWFSSKDVCNMPSFQGDIIGIDNLIIKEINRNKKKK